jgi:outer membrane protein OmpA-like peptidoglycan-associated protein
MGQSVNSAKWETQPSISPDGRILYFVSTRAGGKGKSDIWKTTLSNDGNWSAPVNMGDTINTSEDEFSPFIHPDNNSLYFSSKGHVGMGGFDIFLSRMNENKHWGTPKNLGYPINTLADETSLIVSSSGEMAYFASDKLNGKGRVDIYSFDLYKEVRPLRVTYMKGKVINSKSNAPLEAKFELIDLATAKIIMESKSDISNGEFLVCLPTEKDYALNVSKDGYLFHSENFSLKEVADISKPFLMNIKLQPIEVGEAVVLKNIFFETASFNLKEESKIELTTLIQFLNYNPGVKVEIGGHTDNVGDKQYNVTLSQNRAQSVYNYLIEHAVDKSRLSFKGYGDSKPIAANDTDANKALNRRTEFRIVSVK